MNGIAYSFEHSKQTRFETYDIDVFLIQIFQPMIAETDKYH